MPVACSCIVRAAVAARIVNSARDTTTSALGVVLAPPLICRVAFRECGRQPAVRLSHGRTDAGPDADFGQRLPQPGDQLVQPDPVGAHEDGKATRPDPRHQIAAASATMQDSRREQDQAFVDDVGVAVVDNWDPGEPHRDYSHLDEVAARLRIR